MPAGPRPARILSFPLLLPPAVLPDRTAGSAAGPPRVARSVL